MPNIGERVVVAGLAAAGALAGIAARAKRRTTAPATRGSGSFVPILITKAEQLADRHGTAVAVEKHLQRRFGEILQSLRHPARTNGAEPAHHLSRSFRHHAGR